MSRARRPIPRPVTVASFAAIAVIGLCVVRFRYTVERRWREMERIAAALQRRFDAWDWTRPVLYGETLPGSSQADYAAAMAAVAGDRELEERIAAWRKRRREAPDTVELDEPDELLAGRERVLELLNSGAHRERGEWLPDWERGFGTRIPNLLDARRVANLAELAAGRALACGRPAEAVDALLDACQFGRDLMHSPVLIVEAIGGAMLGTTLAAVDRLDLLDELPAAELDRLAPALARIDEHIDCGGTAWLGEPLLFCRSVLGPDSGLMLDDVRLSADAWRFAFSDRLMCADAALELVERGEQLHAAARLPWVDRQRTIEEAMGDARASPNPLVRIASSNAISLVANRLDAIANLRLLRFALARRLGLEVTLPDPYGGELRTGRDAGGELVYSIGKDGVDDVGVDGSPRRPQDLVRRLR